MSTRADIEGRRIARLAATAGLVILLATSVAFAGRTRFEPAISLGHSYTDNTRYLESSETQGLSDSATTLTVVLPVNRVLKKGELGFAYVADYTKFQKREELDHAGHRMNLDWQRPLDRRSSLGAGANLVLTQDQADPLVDARALTVTQRTDRLSYGANLSYRRQLAKRWGWGAGVVVEQFRFDDIQGVEEGTPILDVEDRTTYRTTLTTGRTLSRKLYLGGRYGFEHFDLDVSGREDVHRLGLDINYRFGKWFGIGLRVGGYKRSRDGADDAGFRDSGLDLGFDFDLGRLLQRVAGFLHEGLQAETGPIRINLDAGIIPSSGGFLQGTSTDATAGFSIRPSEQLARVLNWGFGTRFTRREPSRRIEPTIDTFAINASVQRTFAEQLGVRLSASWVDQSSDDVAAQGIPLNAEYYRTGVQFVWYPKGRLR